MRQNIDNKEIEMATKALELERRGSSSFTFVKHFVSQERHYNKALELACSYLTDEQVREIRRLKKRGLGDRKIAQMYGVSRKIVICIRTGARYADVKDE